MTATGSHQPAFISEITQRLVIHNDVWHRRTILIDKQPRGAVVVLLYPRYGTRQPQLGGYFGRFAYLNEADPEGFRCSFEILRTGEITWTHLDARRGRALLKKPCGHIHLTQGAFIRGAKMLAENQQTPGVVAVKVTEHDLLDP